MGQQTHLQARAQGQTGHAAHPHVEVERADETPETELVRQERRHDRERDQRQQDTKARVPVGRRAGEKLQERRHLRRDPVEPLQGHRRREQGARPELLLVSEGGRPDEGRRFRQHAGQPDVRQQSVLRTEDDAVRGGNRGKDGETRPTFA